MENKPNPVSGLMSDLKLVPYENGFLYRVGKGIKGTDVLMFRVRNVGEGPADSDIWVELKYGTYGQPHKFLAPTNGLEKTCTKGIEIEFPLPEKRYYDPDCEFQIVLDINKELNNESNRDNNFASGVLTKDQPPYPNEYSNNKYCQGNGQTISVRILKGDDYPYGEWTPDVTLKVGNQPIREIPENTNKKKQGGDDTLGFKIPPELLNGTDPIEITIGAKNKTKSHTVTASVR